jgi:hypothetical protein
MKIKGKKEEKVKKKANERERDNKETSKRDCAVYVSLGRFISLTGGSSFRAYGPAHPGVRAGGIAAPGVRDARASPSSFLLFLSSYEVIKWVGLAHDLDFLRKHTI